MDILKTRPRGIELKGEHLFYNILTFMQDDKKAINLEVAKRNILNREELIPNAVLNGFLKKLQEYVELELIDVFNIDGSDHIFWHADSSQVLKDQFGIAQKIQGKEIT